MDKIIEYYSRKDIQKHILSIAKNRELSVKFGEKGFGKRPDILQFENDIAELVKSGATSFHFSEELWSDPLLLESGMNKKQLDNLRIGWDLCLPSFERILVKDEKETKLITFEELAGLLNISKEGRHRINKRINVFAIDPSSMRIRQDGIKEFIIRSQKPYENVIKITLRNGREIYTSPDHPILVFTSMGIGTKKAENISSSDYLIIPLKIDLERKNNNINLIDLIIKNRIEYNHGIKYKGAEISKLIIHNLIGLDKQISGTLRNRIGKTGIPFNIYKELDGNFEYKNKAYLGLAKSNVKIPVNIKLTRDFGKLIGYYLAEGYTEKNRVEFIFHKLEMKEAREVVDITNKVFKTNYDYSIIIKYESKNTLKVRFNSGLLSFVYKDILGFNRLADKKSIPCWVYSAPTGFVGGILSGYFIGDGSAFTESNKFSIRISALTASKDLVEGLSLLLLKLGIHHNLRKKHKKNWIQISGEEGTERFNRCCHVSFIKKKHLKFVRKKINHPSNHTIYPPFLDKNKIRLVNNITIQNNLYRALRLNYGINKTMAKLAANEFLSKIIDSDLLPMKIKCVEKIRYKGLFYDLETKKYNNFLHGDGVFTHNCLDVDSTDFEYSRYATFLIIEALKFHNLKNFSLKFSGNKGFHLGIPFKAFPQKVNDVETKLLFPEGPRVIASYLKYIIKDHLTAYLLKNKTVDKLLKSSGVNKEELVKDGVFNPFVLVDVDTVLISNRHMFRAPYSVNEKSGLVSVPIDPAFILDFSREDATIDKVDAKLGYLDNFKEGEATHLITQAFDWNQKLPSQTSEKVKETKSYVYQEIGNAIPEDLFPPCIKIGLSGLADGKKRFLFILLNFLSNTGYGEKEIGNLVFEWNKKNPEPLRENYITAQLSWHKRQKQKILPPNCDNQQYYVGLQICKPDNFCKLIKNPVHYAIRKNRFEEEKKSKKKTK